MKFKIAIPPTGLFLDSRKNLMKSMQNSTPKLRIVSGTLELGGNVTYCNTTQCHLWYGFVFPNLFHQQHSFWILRNFCHYYPFLLLVLMKLLHCLSSTFAPVALRSLILHSLILVLPLSLYLNIMPSSIISTFTPCGPADFTELSHASWDLPEWKRAF